MKKFLLSAIAVFAFTFASAQEETQSQEFGFQKNDVFIEGNVGFTSSKNTYSNASGSTYESKSNSFNLNPKIGYFISNKFALGVELGFQNSNNKNIQFTAPDFGSETKRNSFGAGVFARYYFLEFGKRFKTYSDFGLGIFSNRDKTFANDSQELINDSKGSSFNTGLSLGFQYFITKKVAMNFGLSDILFFTSGNSKDRITENENNFSFFSSNLNLFNSVFGLTYKF